ncbi:MAG: MFS transporter [Actinomycetales bacterium]|nr:MFS transporter [Actinomycetales bacterium]
MQVGSVSDSNAGQPTVTLQTRTIRTLAAAAVFAGIGTASTTPAGSLLIAEITGTETLAGLTQTCGLIGAAVAALVLVRLTARGGRRLALRTGYAVGLAGTALAVWAGVHRSAAGLLFAAFLVGWTVAASLQARFAAVDLADAATRARSLSFVVWGSTVGAVLGPNLLQPSGKFARALHMPALTGPYLIAALSIALAGLTLTLFLRPDPYLHAAALNGTSLSLQPRPRLRDGLRLVSGNADATLGLAAVVIGHVAMVSIMVMTPVHMKHVDVSLTVIGLVISVHVAGMYAFSPIVGSLADRLGRRRVIAAGAATLITAAVVAGSAPGDSSLQLGLGLLLLGLGWSMTLVGGSTLLADSTDPAHKTTVQGSSDLMMSAAGAVGGALAGVVIAEFNYAVLCASVVPLLILLLLRSVRRTAA